MDCAEVDVIGVARIREVIKVSELMIFIIGMTISCKYYI